MTLIDLGHRITQLAARGDTSLGKGSIQVRADRARREKQYLADIAVRQSPTGEVEDVVLLRGRVGVGIRRCVDGDPPRPELALGSLTPNLAVRFSRDSRTSHQILREQVCFSESELDRTRGGGRPRSVRSRRFGDVRTRRGGRRGRLEDNARSPLTCRRITVRCVCSRRMLGTAPSVRGA